MKFSKTYFVFLGLCFFSNTSFSQPKIKFDTTVIDFGIIKDSEVIKKYYKFSNIGNKPLILTNVQGTGGGQVPEWYREQPVMPGARDSIAVWYNPIGKEGMIDKTITVHYNSAVEDTFIVLHIKGKVVKTNQKKE